MASSDTKTKLDLIASASDTKERANSFSGSGSNDGWSQKQEHHENATFSEMLSSLYQFLDKCKKQKPTVADVSAAGQILRDMSQCHMRLYEAGHHLSATVPARGYADKVKVTTAPKPVSTLEPTKTLTIQMTCDKVSKQLSTAKVNLADTKASVIRKGDKHTVLQVPEKHFSKLTEQLEKAGVDHKEQPRLMPTIFIKDIPNWCEEKAFPELLVSLNPKVFSSKTDILHVHWLEQRGSKMKKVLARISPSALENLIGQDMRLIVDPVVKTTVNLSLRPRRCRHCLGYGHKAEFCAKKDDPATVQGKGECVVCARNKSFWSARNHGNDISDCPTFQRHTVRYIQQIDFGNSDIRRFLPKFYKR